MSKHAKCEPRSPLEICKAWIALWNSPRATPDCFQFPDWGDDKDNLVEETMDAIAKAETGAEIKDE